MAKRAMDIRRKAVTLSMSIDDGMRSPIAATGTGADAATLGYKAVDSPSGLEKPYPADIRAMSESETSRSSTPSNFGYPASTSSWATSFQQDSQEAESNYPQDDDLESCADKWDDDPPSMSARGSPFLRDGDLHKSPGANDDQIRPSQIQIRPKTVAVVPLKETRTTSSEQELESDSSGSEAEADDLEGDDDDDFEWSGENENLDAAVIAAVDGDLALAAFLIPLLHKDFKCAVKTKIERWQHGTAAGAGGSDGQLPPSCLPSSSNTSNGSNPRKRRRRSSSGNRDGGDGDKGDDTNGGGPSKTPSQGEADGAGPQWLLACPFHKWNPSKYGIQHSGTTISKKHDYRACAGPGFKSVQRLKEHLKRKHTPIQCDRCYTIFSGSDRPVCIDQLTHHRQQDVVCTKGDPDLKEGISESQWATLEKQNRKKNQETHRVEKWFEIWAIIFPNITKPNTPWYDGIYTGADDSPSQSRESEAFGQLFHRILDHKIRQGDLKLPEGFEDLVVRLRSVAQQAFRTYVNLHGSLARNTDTTATSSSVTGSNNQASSSLVGGSSTTLLSAVPSNTLSQPTSVLTSTSVNTATHIVSQRQQQQQQQPAGAYAMGIAATAGVSVGPGSHAYAMATGAPIAMSRQASQYCHQPAPAQLANFPPMGQDEMAMYAYMPSAIAFPRRAAWPTAATIPYTAMASHHHGFGPEFFGQEAGFVPDNSQADEFADL